MFWPFRTRDGRAIFHYHDGLRSRAIDPIVAMRGLESHKTLELAATFKRLTDGDPEAIQQTVDATREIFGVPAWSETSKGLTEGETLALFAKFLLYAEALKKNISPQPTTPRPLVQHASGDSAESATKCSPDSGSIETGPKSG